MKFLKIHIVLLWCLFMIIALGAEETHAERFFQQHSTWYEKIPPNPELTSNSSDSINYHCKTAKGWCVFMLSNGDWGHPIWYADADTPTTDVKYLGWSIYKDAWDRAAAEGWTVNIPIPDGAKSAGMDTWCAGTNRDALMTVVRKSTNEAWGFFKARNCGSGWEAAVIRWWDLTSDGINSPYDGITTTHGTNTPLLHGTITYQEAVVDGVIDHAINVTATCAKQSKGVYPSEGRTQGIKSCSEDALPYGSRIQLLPSVDCNTYYGSLTTAENAICVALQTYGAIIVDCGASNKFWIESLKAKEESWSGQVENLSGKIKWTDFRVIKPLKPPFNPSSFDFSLSNSGNLSVNHGSSVSITITASLISGTSQPVSFSISGLPVSATSSFSSITCTATCSTTLTIVTSSSTPLVTNKLTVTGTGGGISKQTSFDLIVTDNIGPAPPPTMKVDWVSP